jgi:hypothetical protein
LSRHHATAKESPRGGTVNCDSRAAVGAERRAFTPVSGGGFGIWELAYPVVATPVVYRALQSYRYIGLAWLMHAAWDLPHHLWGNPMWPFMRTSSFGCFVFDSLIALWFLAGAPDVVRDVQRYRALFNEWPS